MTTKLLHDNCIGCLAQTEHDATDAVLVLVSVLYSGDLEISDIYGDLCFLHRRIVDGAAKEILEERKRR
jgi:hypothetical protein